MNLGERERVKIMIYNRKRRKQCLLRILACQIIATSEIENTESLAKITENLADIAYYVEGLQGMQTVLRRLEARCIK